MDTSNIQQIKQRYGIIGNADGLDRALDVAIQVAPTDLSVLVVGESGVGKEVIPKIIHDNSSRKHNKYFAINCGSIPEGTIDSELFGHAKGAFTGAVGEREGYFGAANKGTLFLDEVGELPLATQARLLRVLETGEYIRVGESEVRKTDVRIVAATNVQMRKAISEGRFREDLYYRLNTIPITLPPLRERGKDIILLFRKFAFDVSEKYRREPIRLTDDAATLLTRYKWPGNIRQLRNLTEQICIICKERDITSDILYQFGITDDSANETGIVKIGAGKMDSDKESGHSYEKERDLLFQILSSINKEVKDLKDMVHSNVQNIPHNQPQPAQHVIIDENFYDSPRTVAPSGYEFRQENEGTYISKGNGIKIHREEPAPATYYSDPDDFYEETPKSMKEIERINIIQALERNNGKRKKAATELGISERTLYRKIKELGLEKDKRGND